MRFSRFQEVYQKRHQLAKDWKKEGRGIFGYLYSVVPEEIIYAAGIIPVQLTLADDEEPCALGMANVVPYACNLMLSCYGQGLRGDYSYLDGLVIPDACTIMRGFGSLWYVNMKTPYFYYLSIPSEVTEGSRAYEIEQFTRFKRSIEEYCGKEISDDSLRSAIDVYNENRRLLKRLYELRLQDNPPITGSQVLDVVKAGLVIPKEEHNKMLRELLDDISGKTGEHTAKLRLMVSMVVFEECATAGFNILEMIKEVGGSVVFDDLCMGPRYFWEPVEVKRGLIESLVERYLGKVPIASKYSDEDRARLVLEQARRYRVNGLVSSSPLYCDPYLFQQPYLEGQFKEQNIPVLSLEITESMSPAAVRTRIQAFVEMLSESRGN